MKRLIAISVVFALVAGAAFAVDVTGTVIGTVNVLQGSTEKDSKVTAGGGYDRIRLDGSGETGDGDFGGYIRAQGGDFSIDSAYAWWKPLEQLRLIIGQNSDGFWGKEGVIGWGFNQVAQDTSVAINPGIWYGDGWGSTIYVPVPYMHTRYTFFEGMVGTGAGLEITPSDVATINIGIPFMDYDGKEAADVFKCAIAQVSLNFDFGNIAITYDGGGRAVAATGAGGAIYGFFGGTFGDIGVDFGFSYHLKGSADAKAFTQSEEKQPFGVGVGVKYATDSFGVKFRTTAALAGDDKVTWINSSVLPYFNISDNMTAFVNVGVGVALPDQGDTIMGWYFNPYLRVGAEYGPSFYVGLQVASPGWAEFEVGGEKYIGKDKDNVIQWAVPIALVVSF